MSLLGPARYPPFQPRDDETRNRINEFKIEPPIDQIVESADMVIYNSDTRASLHGLIGSYKIQVFHYSFCYNELDLHIIWGCELGLVRVTPFFSQFGKDNSKKADAGKAIGRTRGLKDLVCCLTGGLIARQGYWVPYEAAKQMATTLCFNIRYALVPVFGNDFPGSCVGPVDPRFRSGVVDQETLARCRAQVSQWRSAAAARQSQTVEGSEENEGRRGSDNDFSRSDTTEDNQQRQLRRRSERPVPAPLPRPEFDSGSNTRQSTICGSRSPPRIPREAEAILNTHASFSETGSSTEDCCNLHRTPPRERDPAGNASYSITAVAREVMELHRLHGPQDGELGTLEEIETALTLLHIRYGRVLSAQEALALVPNNATYPNL